MFHVCGPDLLTWWGIYQQGSWLKECLIFAHLERWAHSLRIVGTEHLSSGGQLRKVASIPEGVDAIAQQKGTRGVSWGMAQRGVGISAAPSQDGSAVDEETRGRA